MRIQTKKRIAIAAFVLLIASLLPLMVMHYTRLDPEVRRFLDMKGLAQRGDLKPKYDLAVFYGSGKGTPTNDAAAMMWIRSAAKQGEPRAQAVLAAFYVNGGKGSRQDDIEAESLFRRSAEQGWAEGQHGLGCCYLDGRGTEKDEVNGIAWLAKAAVSGQADAQFAFGTAYVTGTTVQQDYVQAYKWMSLALEQGKGDKTALPALREKMTPE